MDPNEDKELDPLKSAVLSSLQTDGSYNEIRAKVRANVFRVCDNCSEIDIKTNKQNNRKANDENLLINQLIREYFKSNDYNNSLNIFDCETGEQKDSNIDRLSVRNKLGLHSDDQNSDKVSVNWFNALSYC